jgi:hypothetical protein
MTNHAGRREPAWHSVGDRRHAGEGEQIARRVRGETEPFVRCGVLRGCGRLSCQ